MDICIKCILFEKCSYYICIVFTCVPKIGTKKWGAHVDEILAGFQPDKFVKNMQCYDDSSNTSNNLFFLVCCIRVDLNPV